MARDLNRPETVPGAADAQSPTLVTGAGGCIGAWTIRQLLAEAMPVVALDLHRDDRRLRLLVDEAELERIAWVEVDVTDRANVQSALEEHAVGSVIHLAALQAPFCRDDPPLGAAVNVVGTVNLLDALAARGDRALPFVYASSIAAAIHEGEDHPATVYGVYKLACEGAADYFWREHGLSSIGLRPHTVYGPGRDQGMTSAPTLAMLAAARGSEYEIPFTGRITMQYAPDVAAAFIAASRAGDFHGAGVFDLPGATVGIGEIVEAIAEAVPGAAVRASGAPLPFPAGVSPSPDAPSGLNSAPTPLSEGVRETIERFRNLEAHGHTAVASP
jgi:nucleoside-diphosphate-sugar epimerase